MGRIIYPEDLRRLAGKVNDPKPLTDNLAAIEAASESLDWENFKDSTLSAEHFAQPTVSTGSSFGLTKRVRSSSISRLAPATYTKAASQTWQTLMTVTSGPATMVDGTVFRSQCRVYLIGTLSEKGRWATTAGEPLAEKIGEKHKIRFTVDGVATRFWHLGQNPDGCVGGAIHTFTPTQQWHAISLEFMGEWQGNPASTNQIHDDLTFFGGSLTAIEVYR